MGRTCSMYVDINSWENLKYRRKWEDSIEMVGFGVLTALNTKRYLLV
jgi:hypothetical protein